MSVTAEQALAMAALARLRLTPGEADLFATQLTTILGHIAELENVVLDEAGAGDSAAAKPTMLRPDTPSRDSLHIPVAELSPAHMEDLFTVPRLAAMEGGSEDDTGGAA